MQAFSAVLSRLRREAGYPSAYKFYHANGGRRHFGFTYMQYLRIEKGTALPRVGRLPALLSALRLSAGEDASRRLSIAYLTELLDGQQGYELVLSPLLCRHHAAPPAAPALGWLKSEHTVHMTPDQFRVVAADETTYWCSELLLNDSRSWEAAALARELARPVPEVRAACARLVKAGLVSSARGRYRAKRPGKLYTFPGRLPGLEPQLAAVRGFWDAMARRRGGGLFDRIELVRAEESAMRSYWPSLAEAVDAANARVAHAKGEGTALFAIEARVRRLMPF